MRGVRRNRVLFVFAVAVLVAGPATGALAQGLSLPVEVPTGVVPQDLLENATGALPAGVDLPGLPVTASAAGGGELVGLFRVSAGNCAGGAVESGSFFRMVAKLGTRAAGPYVPNLQSACGDKSYSPLRPGTEGGISTAGYQPHPSPAFNVLGGGTNATITEPQTWFGVPFATATNQKDPQTGAAVPAPKIVHDGSGKLSGDMRAFAAAWNGQHFNQGSPKPNGSTPGETTAVSGTYDPASGAFDMEWASSIVGGPFDGFTGIWHFEGTFVPAAQPAAAVPVAAQAEAEAPAASQVQGAQTIPLTGADTGLSIAAGLLFIAVGVWLEIYGRRRCHAEQR